MTVQRFNIEVIPTLPKALKRLQELANDLWYSWDVPTRTLFDRLDSDLWARVGQNPKLFLRSVDQQHLHKAISDPLFMEAYQQIITNYDSYYQNREVREVGRQLEKDDLIVYFCAEYGFHESLSFYSGGLGILAGDFCKSASDLRLPFVAVGLYYHQGYFYQLIDAEGNQLVTRSTSNPHHLPLKPVVDKDGVEIHIPINIADHQVLVKAWQLQVGHITVYLLDTRITQNHPDDLNITQRLYDGDEHLRIKQEIVLGIGGVRMLRTLGLKPTIWHLNEGYTAFSIVERLREQVTKGLSFDAALERVAADTLFTTHSAALTNHDYFDQSLLLHYLGSFVSELGISTEAFFALGCLPKDVSAFNMITLAVTGSRQINGVSRIHGHVSADLCAKYWPQIAPVENPVRYVTNGIHISTFLAREWSDLFDKFFGGEWRNHISDVKFWQRIEKIPAQLFWNVKQIIKSQMLSAIRNALLLQHTRNRLSETHIERMLKFIDPKDPNILTVGFAHRFAAYKRATLLFNNLDWLRVLLHDTERPIVFIFAGKAHPSDVAGQALLKAIYNFSIDPEFLGKVVLMQGYNLGLARHLVSGVDVWLSNAIYPLEACGTSGMKVAINAGINVGVLDGWWAEAYDGENGWAIQPSPHTDDKMRNKQDAQVLYEIFQDDVMPLYYNRGKYSYSSDWVQKAKHSMMTVLPRFNMNRVLNDYLEKFYLHAGRQGKSLEANHGAKAQLLADWKAKIRTAWSGVQIHLLATARQQLIYGESATIQVAVQLNGLSPVDVCVDLLLSRKVYEPEITMSHRSSGSALRNLWQDNKVPTIEYRLVAERPLSENDKYLFSLSFQPEWCGELNYQIRVFPFHQLLVDAHEMGLMKWASSCTTPQENS
jgi:starch phosphorylase